MSDLFHEDVPFDFIHQCFVVMACNNRHVFQVLTKRPERMLEYFQTLTREASWSFPFENVWLGVSVEDQETANERIPILFQCPALRFISYEPALGPLDLGQLERPQVFHTQPHGWEMWLSKNLHWVICGGESGPNARPMHPDWARSVRDQCQAAGIPFFFKQWGEWAPEMQYISPNCYWGEYVNSLSKQPESKEFNDRTLMFRVGKKQAGRRLDGEVWDQYPRLEET